jgi:hypothetical protein
MIKQFSDYFQHTIFWSADPKALDLPNKNQIFTTKEIKFSQHRHVCNWEAKQKKHETSFLYKIQILKRTDNT